ncbi:MAG TPA: tripartite tricarboxylate transporter substrate binding protein [Xanthobacteraceae bacterium]|nr:tripartite tricarboxylate transporter substrate binding protein [Xanthobacteraceae bacterium]
MRHLASYFRAFALVILCVAASNAFAQNYPFRPIHLIVPFAVGGGADTLTRFIAPGLQKALNGTTIVVENRPGAGTVLGVQAVAGAAPDGYTLLITLDQSMTMNPYLYDKLPYDVQRDFLPISLLANSPLLYVINPKVPAKTLKEFVDYAKPNGDKLNFGSGAVSAQVEGALFMETTGVKLPFIPYAGGAPALAALLNNEIQFVIADVGTFRAATADGRLTGLAVTSAQRLPQLPNVPTIAEAGFKDLEHTAFWGLWAPKGTPAAIIDVLSAAVRQALNDKEVKDKIAGIGAEAKSSSPAELAAMVKTASDTWGPIIKRAGIKAN